MVIVSDAIHHQNDSINQTGKGAISLLGSLNGQKVSLQGQQASVLDKIQESAEEATFFNRRGEKSQTLKAKLESKRGSPIKHKSTLQELNNFLTNQKGSISSESLNEARVQILMTKNLSTANLASILERLFSDITDQFLALVYLEQTIDGNEQLKKLIKKMRKDLEDDNGPEIYAGLNITQESLKFVRGDRTKIPQARKFYRQNILGYQSIADVYRNILNEYGSGKFFDSLDFLLNALGADLNSKRSSLSDIQLKPILDDISQLQNLKTINEHSGEMISFLKKYYSLKMGAKSTDVLDFVLPVIANDYTSVTELEGFCQNLGIGGNIEAKIACANYLDKSIREVPEKVFKGQNSREDILSTIHNYGIVLYDEEVS